MFTKIMDIYERSGKILTLRNNLSVFIPNFPIFSDKFPDSLCLAIVDPSLAGYRTLMGILLCDQ